MPRGFPGNPRPDHLTSINPGNSQTNLGLGIICVQLSAVNVKRAINRQDRQTGKRQETSQDSLFHLAGNTSYPTR